MKVGIDPGKKHLALAVLNESNEVIELKHIDPSGFSSQLEAVDYLFENVPYLTSDQITSCSIEKYVIYGKGIPSKHMIDTVMLIGALHYAFHQKGIACSLVRAIDWKKKVSKELYKARGFQNPSTKFDKKFSMAACHCICGITPKTDHEADAVGVAFYSAL